MTPDERPLNLQKLGILPPQFVSEAQALASGMVLCQGDEERRVEIAKRPWATERSASGRTFGRYLRRGSARIRAAWNRGDSRHTCGQSDPRAAQRRSGAALGVALADAVARDRLPASPQLGRQPGR